MKHLKIFESFLPREQYFKNICWYNAKIGDILPEEDVYQYVQSIHDDYESSFIDGDLGDRIEEFEKYELKIITIKEIDIDEFSLDTSKMREYIKEYKNSNNYPPIVLNDEYGIIDGTHRVNALERIGLKEVKAWVGISNS
jgi:glutaredoxin